jgi:pimeloyl-ACP methyl ester carboxylesterase
MPNQHVRFCRSFDGAEIAYAVAGNGPPVLMLPNWLTHLEHLWRSVAWRPWLEALSKRHRLVRCDPRGCGLSDRNVRGPSFESWVRDFGAVVDAVGLDRFSLVGICQGGPIAIEFAARQPERCRRRRPRMVRLRNSPSVKGLSCISSRVGSTTTRPQHISRSARRRFATTFRASLPNWASSRGRKPLSLRGTLAMAPTAPDPDPGRWPYGFPVWLGAPVPGRDRCLMRTCGVCDDFLNPGGRSRQL